MKDFPTIYFREENEAFFYIGSHLVRVPWKSGTTAHVVPWLRRQWPFNVKHGRLVQRRTLQVNGKRREVETDLGKLYAEAAHRDREFTYITTIDGNFLHWSVENIVPVRNPSAPATDKEIVYEVERQMREHRLDGSLPFFMRYGAKFLHAHGDVLTTEQSTLLQTDWVKKLREAESMLAADRTRDDVEHQNFVKHNLSGMPRPDLVIETRPENYPDGVAHTRPAAPTRTIGWYDENAEVDDTARNRKLAAQDRTDDAEANGTEEQHKIRVRLEHEDCGYSYPVPSRDKDRADLQGKWNDPSTEAVLNRHGWYTPGNGGHPRYEGKGAALGAAYF